MFLWYQNCSRKVKLSSRLLSMVSQFCVHQRVVPLWKAQLSSMDIKDHSRFCVEREISATGSWFARIRVHSDAYSGREFLYSMTLRKSSSHGASLSRSAMQSIFNFRTRTRGYGCGIARLFFTPIHLLSFRRGFPRRRTTVCILAFALLRRRHREE